MNASANNAQPTAATVNDPRWAAVVARDPEADGTFYYSVQTTGVYGRLSCAARLARPEHVRFHTTCEDAEKAGFRPCKRCKPHQPPLVEQYAAKVTEACRIIEASETVPGLEDLAIRGGAPRETDAPCTRPQRYGDGSHFRCRLQLQWPFLRNVE